MLLGRSKAEQCKTLLDMISEGRAESAVTHFSIHSVETVMRKKAGVLTSFLLGRSKAEQCKTLLDMISEGRAESAVTHFSIHSVETIMRKKPGVLTSFLRALDQTVGLYVFDTTLAD